MLTLSGASFSGRYILYNRFQSKGKEDFNGALQGLPCHCLSALFGALLNL
jgi:hypothetical protein